MNTHARCAIEKSPDRTYPLYAKVLLNLPLDEAFDYGVPKALAEDICAGKRVWVDFGQRRLVGYVIGVSPSTEVSNIKPVIEVIDDTPILSDEILRLTREISEYYMCSWGEALDAAVPSSLKKGKTEMVSRVSDDATPVASSDHLKLTQEQATAVDAISRAVEEDRHEVFLLHGITGSGKTEVYLQAISKALERGGGCIVLVPEISLTPQTVERFRSRFQEKVAVFHSRLTAGQKYLEWKKLREGTCHIVVGARSAIFSPVRNLKLIVVDEEHDTSYKQQDAPRYNAVDVAAIRGRLSKAVVILGTATPSLESYYKAKNGVYRLLELTHRIQQRPLPNVKIIDMRQELIERRRRRIIFSRYLIESMERVVKNNEQVILFLNRRGFSTYANCKRCGHVEVCKKCNVALNYHSDRKKLICHYCNYQKEPVNICPSCNGSYIDYFGFGTQRVESELHRHFPTESIARMDTDATTKRGSHDMILKAFAQAKTRILIGTQMVAKGHDFPGVTLVGVISADTALNLPDLRAGERTFQLLTQVAGRAGRGVLAGEVIIQTYVPHHYTITSAIYHDYIDFYKKEIALRKELLLPPFSNLITLTARSYKEDKARACAEDLAREILRKRPAGMIDLTGPAEAFVYRLRRQYRWNIILKVKDIEKVTVELKALLKRFKKPHGVTLTADVDPL